MDAGEKRMIAVARRDHEEWMAAYRREKRRGTEASADACLEGANAVEQLIKRMEREAKA